MGGMQSGNYGNMTWLPSSAFLVRSPGEPPPLLCRGQTQYREILVVHGKPAIVADVVSLV